MEDVEVIFRAARTGGLENFDLCRTYGGDSLTVLHLLVKKKSMPDADMLETAIRLIEAGAPREMPDAYGNLPVDLLPKHPFRGSDRNNLTTMRNLLEPQKVGKNPYT